METGDVPLEEMLDAIEKRGIDLATLEFLDLDYDEVRELYLAVKYR